MKLSSRNASPRTLRAMRQVEAVRETTLVIERDQLGRYMHAERKNYRVGRREETLTEHQTHTVRTVLCRQRANGINAGRASPVKQSEASCTLRRFHCRASEYPRLSFFLGHAPERILIADDVSTARVSLRRLLESRSGWRVCGEAVNGLEAVEQSKRLAPDLVILDLRMPLMNGFQAAREISRINPHPPMLLITFQALSQSHLEAARSAGFSGAVNKDCGRDILAAVEAVLNNQMFFHLPRSLRIA